MTKNRLSDLNDHIIAQIERLCDDDLPPEAVERESRRSIALVALADQAVRTATLQAIKMLHDHDGRDPDRMLRKFIDNADPVVVNGRSLSVVSK